jgi:hypothetical protein
VKTLESGPSIKPSVGKETSQKFTMWSKKKKKKDRECYLWYNYDKYILRLLSKAIFIHFNGSNVDCSKEDGDELPEINF